MRQQPESELFLSSFGLNVLENLRLSKQEFSKFLISIFVPILISFIPFCNCKENKRISLTFDQTSFAPDGFSVPGISINGQSPGETLIFRSHESYEIEVVNNLDHGLTLHLHGLHFKGANEYDGVPFITQNPIREQSSFVYRVNTGNQSGTFIYHAHTRLDIQWAYGALIIDDNWKIGNVQDYSYDKECVVFISQLFHANMETVMKDLVGKPFKYVPHPKSLLIQAPSCSVPTTTTQNKYPILPVNPGQTVRFRVIGMGMDSMLSFRIANHTLKVIEADQIPVEPVTTNFLWVNSAQRYSVIVKMDQPVGNYLFETEMVPADGPTNGLAVLHYEGASDAKNMANLKRDPEAHTPKKILHRWILDDLRPSTKIESPDVYPVPQVIDREIIITSFQRNVNGFQKFDINHVVHKKPDLTLLEQLKNGKNISANKENGVYEIVIGERVQIVFQNTMSDEAVCEQHPWHIHGHTFYVVGEGPDAYDPKRDKQIIENNIRSKNGAFQFRDVVTLFPNQTKCDTSNRAPCGWAAVRFVADNPGVWVCHCHFQAHHIMGKYFTLYAHT